MSGRLTSGTQVHDRARHPGIDQGDTLSREPYPLLCDNAWSLLQACPNWDHSRVQTRRTSSISRMAGHCRHAAGRSDAAGVPLDAQPCRHGHGDGLPYGHDAWRASPHAVQPARSGRSHRALRLLHAAHAHARRRVRCTRRNGSRAASGAIAANHHTTKRTHHAVVERASTRTTAHRLTRDPAARMAHRQACLSPRNDPHRA